MSDYPIFCRTMIIVIPVCTTVPLFGLLIGGIFGAFAAVVSIRGLA